MEFLLQLISEMFGTLPEEQQPSTVNTLAADQQKAAQEGLTANVETMAEEAPNIFSVVQFR